MDNVIFLKGFRFQDYKIGRRHLLRFVDRANVSEDERAAFCLRQLGDFFRLARLRSALSVEAAAPLFGLSAEELSRFEGGDGGKIPASLLVSFCTRYGVEKDFEEFYSYLHSVTSSKAKAAVREARPMLERMGLFRPKDW